MILSAEDVLFFVIIILCLDMILICQLFFNKASRIENRTRMQRKQQSFIEAFFTNGKFKVESDIIQNYNALKESFILDVNDIQRVKDALHLLKIEQKYIRTLQSPLKSIRMESAIYLGVIGTETARHKLEEALERERNLSVKLYIANALGDIGDARSIPYLVASLINANRWYRDRMNMLIAGFGQDFYQWLPNIINSSDIEIKELIVDFADGFIAEDLQLYLTRLIDTEAECIIELENRYQNLTNNCCGNCIYGRIIDQNGNHNCQKKGTVEATYHCRYYRRLPVSIEPVHNYHQLVIKAVEIVAKYYSDCLQNPKYLYSTDVSIKNIAVKSLANNPSPKTLELLIQFMLDSEVDHSAMIAIAQMVEKDPAYLNLIIEKLKSEKSPVLLGKFAEILSTKIEYFIVKLTSPEKEDATEIIRQILMLGKTKEIIGFLHRNRDVEIEQILMTIIYEVTKFKRDVAEELGKYLPEAIIEKWGMEKYQKQPDHREENIVYSTKLLFFLFYATLFLFPVIFCVIHFRALFSRAPLELLKMFVVDFNYYIVYYSITINLFSLGLMILSLVSVRKQWKLWNIKKTTMLFKKRMLPSISIIAPAYNEEKTVVESTNSLLNLRYPDYELILVNDGSQDDTLRTLIEHFKLERVEYPFVERLKTMPVRGVYINRSLPKLIVIDKENGGKADSLNAGINISNKEYFCGIDADSLLEEESLLKLASMTIDQGCETPALGGSIFPINGCLVDRGKVVDYKIPRSSLALLQMVEYACSFMAGRLGWSLMNSLLIISGAFGLFRKERVISVGGYLTSRERFQKDTVGEDMELVVRISRYMREKKLEHRICYSFNANCWTEVPENLKNLKRQRSRWQRGLIEVLMYHKDMFFNTKFGLVGMISVPYYFIFETYGPIIEMLGYIFVFVAYFMKLLNFQILVLLFFASILLRILVSLVALLIAEKDMDYYSYKDIARIVLYTIFDNLGPRQLFGFWRVSGYLHALRKQRGWDKFERKGFTGQVLTKEV